jgi:hypothetical protein
MEEFDINNFYRWAFNKYGDKNSTHPLNWITLARNSSAFGNEKILLKGLNPMIKSMKELLIGKKYEYVISPCAYNNLTVDVIPISWDVENLAPIYYGELSFDDEEFYLSGFENNKILLKKCWIIKEVGREI